jgi:hypothetical protein
MLSKRRQDQERKMAMPEPKRKETFGTLGIDHFSPDFEEVPGAVNIHLSIDEAMKLHLGLTHILCHLNGFKLSTREGKRLGVNLCVFPSKKRITINKSRTVRGE